MLWIPSIFSIKERERASVGGVKSVFLSLLSNVCIEIMLFDCIWEVPSLTLSQDTSCPDGGVVWPS